MRSLVFVGFIALMGCQQSHPTAPASAPAQPLKAPGDAVLGDRTTCPVSQEEFVVAADSPKVEHNGKTYYFCCDGCDGKFLKNPEKYLGKN